jgi:hypothetical protein
MRTARLFLVLLLGSIVAVRPSSVPDINRLAVRSTDFDSVGEARSDQSQRNHAVIGEDSLVGP